MNALEHWRVGSGLLQNRCQHAIAVSAENRVQHSQGLTVTVWLL